MPPSPACRLPRSTAHAAPLKRMFYRYDTVAIIRFTAPFHYLLAFSPSLPTFGTLCTLSYTPVASFCRTMPHHLLPTASLFCLPFLALPLSAPAAQNRTAYLSRRGIFSAAPPRIPLTYSASSHGDDANLAATARARSTPPLLSARCRHSVARGVRSCSVATLGRKRTQICRLLAPRRHQNSVALAPRLPPTYRARGARSGTAIFHQSHSAAITILRGIALAA